MRKIKAYTGDSYAFHEKVVAGKRRRPSDPTYQERLKLMNGKIEKQYGIHDEEFKNNNLAVLKPYPFTQIEKDDLLSLYNYRSEPFRALNDILTRTENGNAQPICPFCTINNVNSLDHLIPKMEFPEFSDHPRNLMPCCSECNSRKSSKWRVGNESLYLNLYLDDLPDIQYLFASLMIEESTIKVHFSVENKFGIPEKLYKKIENHYRVLDLCERFSRNSYGVISELKNSIQTFGSRYSIEELKSLIIRNADENRKIWGFNYWKSILMHACCDTEGLIDFLLK